MYKIAIKRMEDFVQLIGSY